MDHADVLSRLEQDLRAAPGIVVLCGERGSGKSTLLRRLLAFLPSPSFMPVYQDLAGWARRPGAKVFGELAAGLAAPLGLSAPDMDGQGRRLREDLLPRVREVLGEECRPVLVLDHLDRPGAQRERRGAALLAGLQRLAREPGLGLVVAVSGPPEGLPAALKDLLRGARWHRLAPSRVTPVRPALPPPWRSLLFGGAGVVLAGLCVGTLASPRPRPATPAAAPPARPPAPPPAACPPLAALDQALRQQRWEDVRVQAEAISGPPEARAAALAMKARAEEELRARSAYERFAAAAGGGGGPELLSARLLAIPDSSIYRRLAREAYGPQLASALRDRLVRAEEARRAGRCWEFRYWLSRAEAMDPQDPHVARAGRQRCRGGEETSFTKVLHDFHVLADPIEEVHEPSPGVVPDSLGPPGPGRSP